ncbi:hypothetical protein CQW23_31880 [Capsicum baccatum]|uniref:Calmodulin-binding domain-containing protein n=1 Tax=Capsicum baccatum TaxID=33114 RepID=A0A2G2V6G8_CAPBA|nr:hypothetical protein CQW23_31880 [Capsicum baccatum]
MTGCSNDNNSSTVKLKFRRGNTVDFQQETSSPRRLIFRWGRHVSESQDNNIRKRIFKKKGFDGDKSNTIPISVKIVLRHQDVQEKKDVQGLLNNVIEETASKLVETGRSKVSSQCSEPHHPLIWAIYFYEMNLFERCSSQTDKTLLRHHPLIWDISFYEMNLFERCSSQTDVSLLRHPPMLANFERNASL